MKKEETNEEIEKLWKKLWELEKRLRPIEELANTTLITIAAANTLTNVEPMPGVRTVSHSLIRVPASEVLGKINHAIGTKFRSVESNLKFIRARQDEGASVTELVDVAIFKNHEWKSNPEMRKYLRIETLYNATKFQSYLAEVDAAKEREVQYDELR